MSHRSVPPGPLLRRVLSVACLLLAGGCGTPPAPPRVDPEIERAARVARAAFQMGSTKKAALMYRRALKRAKALDDSTQIANNAYNLAACLVAEAQYEEARLLLKEAAIELSRAGLQGGNVFFLQAKVARLTGEDQQAEVLAEAALAAPERAKDPNFRVQVHLLKAHVACDRDYVAGAETELLQAEELLKKVSDLNVLAQFSGVSGRVAVLKNDYAQAAVKFDEMAEALRRAGNHREMTAAVKAAAQAYAKMADYPAAADRYFRAARSQLANDRAEDARQTMNTVRPILERIEDLDLREQIGALSDEIGTAIAEQAEAQARDEKRTNRRSTIVERLSE